MYTKLYEKLLKGDEKLSLVGLGYDSNCNSAWGLAEAIEWYKENL